MEPIPNLTLSLDDLQLGEKHEKKLDYKQYQANKIAALVESEGWQELEKAVIDRIRLLKSMVDPEIEGNLFSRPFNPFLVGLRTIIVFYAIKQLRFFLHMPKLLLSEKLKEESKRTA